MRRATPNGRLWEELKIDCVLKSLYHDGFIACSGFSESKGQITDRLSKAFHLQLFIINEGMMLNKFRIKITSHILPEPQHGHAQQAFWHQQ
jgi:hypothetical protein